MQIRANRPTERAGVNAAQALFESENWIFQPVDQGNDYGKDAYVDASDGQTVTGVCATLQIKSGVSFRRASGYAIPVEGHECVWRESPLPVMGIIHDPNTGRLYWCDISGYLRDHPNESPISIAVSAESVLDKASLNGEFLERIRRNSEQSRLARSLLDLCSDSTDLQVASILSCFRASMSDQRPLVLVRRLIGSFTGPSYRAALHMLTLMTPHADIIWTSQNRLPESIRTAVSGTFCWTESELVHMIANLDWEEWQRGGSGEDLYMLLNGDPEIQSKLRRLLTTAVADRDERVAWTSLYLLIYWAGEKGRDEYEQITIDLPEVRSLSYVGELEAILVDNPNVILFE
jgi:hypothetical protein